MNNASKQTVQRTIKETKQLTRILVQRLVKLALLDIVVQSLEARRALLGRLAGEHARHVALAPQAAVAVRVDGRAEQLRHVQAHVELVRRPLVCANGEDARARAQHEQRKRQHLHARILTHVFDFSLEMYVMWHLGSKYENVLRD